MTNIFSISFITVQYFSRHALITSPFQDACFLYACMPRVRYSVCALYRFVTLIKRYWNDRRSRRVFLCFYAAIFQLTSAKFQTFPYHSRTVGSSNMKFGQQFEINELYVCTKFRGNRSRDFGFRT